MASSGTGQSGRLHPAPHAPTPAGEHLLLEPELVSARVTAPPMRAAAAEPEPQQVIEESDEAAPEQEPPPPVAPQPVPQQEIEEPDEAVPEQEPPPPVAPQPVVPVAPEPAPQQVQEPAPGDGNMRVRMFAEFLELPKKIPHWIWPRATGKAMHPELLMPVRCGHCRQLEDLSRPPTSIRGATNGRAPPDHLVTVADAALVDQIAFEGNSCLNCVKMIYEKTRPSSEQAGSDTPLHYAARSRNFKMLFHFICLFGDEYGFERVAQVLRKLNGRSETALHEAIWQRNMYMAELLMRVDPKLAKYPPAGQGTSPLYLALSLDSGHIARMLLSRSGGELSYSGPDGQNALHAAALYAYAMIPTLLDWKEDLCNEKDGNDITPLHLVSAANAPFLFDICCFRFPNIWFPLENLPVWRVLHANTSAAWQRDKNGVFPIHIAALMNSKTSIRVLLRGYPRCIGFRDNQGRSFLHIAVQNKSSSVVRYACEESRFASIMNAQDNDGNTALHLSVDVGDLSAFCALLRNPEVLLNIRNNKDQTPLDLAYSKMGEDFSYNWNPEWVIHETFIRAGAKHGRFWRDCIQQLCSSVPEPLESQEDTKKKEEKEKEESAKVIDSTRTLGIGSVLIASVTFTAAFTVPAGIKASDHTKDGTPGLLGMWYFNAFMMANALAFICSSIAILGLIFAGMPTVKLPIRYWHLKSSVFFAWSSLTCLNVAFALGVYMVLAPVGRKNAIAICAFAPLVLIYRNADHLRTIFMISRPLYVRRGFKYVCTSFMARIFGLLISEFWPFAIIFMWAAPRLA